MKSTQDYSAQIDKLKSALDNAEAIVIGAGAGLSTSAGFVYSGKRFQDNFGDFEDKYGFHDMYSGGFYPYSTPEEYWAYWSRNIYVNRYTNSPKPVYEDLHELVKDKNYFVITTNVDHCFQRAGFDKQKLFYTQGDYGLFQCSQPCHDETYDNEALIRRMVKEQKDMKIPTALIPHCPKCGKPMTTNLRCDDKFVEDSGWHLACERYESFIKENRDKRILYLELGVGGNTPAIIKYPFWRLTNANPQATYACINYGEAICPPQIESRSICINQDIGEVLKSLCESK
ncbi:MAG: Sir2 silent information regulator family NAD-dependent deacetylase [Clostridia bacterium]|nr:Sir2 silent information regulator family NAD-dependent deacetylase [Clostridia bacterium]